MDERGNDGDSLRVENRGISRSAGLSWETLQHDLVAGVTVALVAIPQCLAFATITGLPAVTGIYSAVAMGLLSSAISKSPKLVVGPAITASTMLLAVLQTVAPSQPGDWPAIAGFLAVAVGIMTAAAAMLNVGRFVRFVSRSVIVGLIAGSAILTIGSQLSPLLGLPVSRHPMLVGILWNTLSEATGVHSTAVMMALGTAALVLIGSRLGSRFPSPFVALVASGVAAWWLERHGMADGLPRIGELPWRWPAAITPPYSGPFTSELLVGAAAICLVGIIQNLAIAQALANRSNERLHATRELWALGLANIAAGLANGMPGSGSFARSALSDLAGSRTRLAGFAAALATGIIAALGAPLAKYITLPSIAGLLVVTAISMVDWRELAHIVWRDPHDRPVLLTTIACVFFLPIHWAVMVGLAASIILFLRRVSRLHLFEMVRGADDVFREHTLDTQTGRSAITMLQVEGPLFFAHAEELTDALAAILGRRPTVVILRMRRTQQIDFSVLAAIERVIRRYQADGGHLLVCGVAPRLRQAIMRSPLGQAIEPDHLFQTTHEVFGAARQAINCAEAIASQSPRQERALFRHVADVETKQAEPAEAST